MPVLGCLFARIVRMSVTASEAARALVAQRWGSQRPTRLARELAKRAAEVPEPERSELIAALKPEPVQT